MNHTVLINTGGFDDEELSYWRKSHELGRSTPNLTIVDKYYDKPSVFDLRNVLKKQHSTLYQ
jgi:hypothetical protein